MGGAAAASSAPNTQALQSPQGGAAEDAQRGALETLMGQIRDVDQMVQAMAGDFPHLGSDVNQIRQILKRMIIQSAAQAPAQSASGMAVPTGGTP